MTLEEIDIKLAAWQADVATLHANISELQSLIGYQLARDGRELSGATKEKHQKAVDAEARLWVKVDLFSKLVVKIKDKRDNLPTFGKGRVLEEIEQMFDGESIDLPPEQVALENRDLFAGSQNIKKMTVATLRQLMSRDFQQLRDAYVTVGEAWQKVGEEIAAVKKEVERICAEERQYGRENSTDVAALSARLESTTRRWRNDPLGVTEDIKKDLAPYFKAANNFIAGLARERAQIAADVRTAAEKLELLKARKVKALELHQACVVEVGGSEEPKVPPSTRGLSDWLARLNAMLADEKWDDTKHNVKEWFGLHDRISRDTEAAISFNKALTDKRAELKRRFLEAVVKYKDYGSRGMEIPKSVHTFTEKGQELLKGKVDLVEAERIILALEVKVGEICAEFDRAKETSPVSQDRDRA